MSGTAPYYTQAFSPLPRPLLPPGRWRRGRRPDPLPGPARLAGSPPRNRRSSLSTSMRVSVSLVEAAAAEHEGVFLEAGLVLLVVELWCGSSTLLAAWIA
jgi:hypothetical protein